SQYRRASDPGDVAGMNTTLLLAILAMVAVGAAGFSLVPSALSSSRANARRKAYPGAVRTNRRVADDGRNRQSRRKAVQQAIKAQNEELNAKKRLTRPHRLFQAGMTITPAVYIRNSLILGAIVFVILFLVQ